MIAENNPDNFKTQFEQLKQILKSLQDAEKIEIELDKYDLLTLKDHDNKTILHHLCRDGEKEIINKIIDYFKSKSKQIPRFGQFADTQDEKTWSAIYYAIDVSESGFPDVVDIFLKNGSNVNIKDCKQITPLHLAAYKGQDDNVEILLKYKAEVDLKDAVGRTPLNFAVMEGQTNAVQALLDNNANINTTDVNGDSLLHYAILGKGNALLYVIMLAERGINVNIKNKEGDTPLLLAAKTGCKENVRLIEKLLEYKADDKIRNNKGEGLYGILGEEALNNNIQISESNSETKGNTGTNNFGKIKKRNTFFFYVIIPAFVVFIVKVLIKILQSK